MRREVCGECGSPINDDGACDCTELLKRGWRQCAVGQKTTQWCAEAEALKAENEALRAEVAEWKARADELAAALNKCIKLAYNRDLDELPSAIITTASKAVAKYDMLVDFSAALDNGSKLISFYKAKERT